MLLNHSRETQIGVVENAKLVNRQGLANLRFSKGVTGEEIYRDVLDGIRSQISCGYRILKWEIDETDPNRSTLHNHPVATLRNFNRDLKRRPHSFS